MCSDGRCCRGARTHLALTQLTPRTVQERTSRRRLAQTTSISSADSVGPVYTVAISTAALAPEPSASQYGAPFSAL